ncbi:hypothetical protein GN244_ATG13026 [Phytophthora infestans]|uniref:Integrase catalytic domain-containing protein n=1 Tax=Phytophthora infestans TaxID=4787 RepID=A0A833T0P2_PHYIN|nr:hypothetical protein GN244_ATG13026 [Phytophthora infestans]
MSPLYGDCRWWVPRPHGETLLAMKPNELLHFDFPTMIKENYATKYVLVLYDKMSGFVDLVTCVAANSDQIYTSILDYFKRYGVMPQWVPDQGGHFKNQLFDQLRVALNAHHRVQTVGKRYRVVVNREVIKGVKALLRKKRMHLKDWLNVLPIIQYCIHTDGHHGSTRRFATTWYFTPSDPTVVTVSWTENQTEQRLALVWTALDDMHLELTIASAKPAPRCTEGDFVLAATATVLSSNRLALVGRVPTCIIKALNDYTFRVQDLVEPLALRIRLAFRLQLNRDTDRGRTEALVEQAIQDQGGGFWLRLYKLVSAQPHIDRK